MILYTVLYNEINFKILETEDNAYERQNNKPSNVLFIMDEYLLRASTMTSMRPACRKTFLYFVLWLIRRIKKFNTEHWLLLKLNKIYTKETKFTYTVITV